MINKTKISDIKKEIIKNELKINNHLLKIGDIDLDEHKTREKYIRNIFKGTGSNLVSIVEGLNRIGFDYQDGYDYVLRILTKR